PPAPPPPARARAAAAPGLRPPADPYEAHRPDSLRPVLRDRRLEGIDPHLEPLVGRQHAQLITPDADRVDRLVDRDVSLLRRVHGPALAHALLLRAVARHRVARELQADEVRRHPAARQVPA